MVASHYNDCILPLDELAQADSKSVADMVYMLANNQGKRRLRSEIILREAPRWRMLILSIGEIDLAAKILENGKRAFAGLDVRFISVPAICDQFMGIFEDLHGFRSGEELSRHLKEASNKYYGTAIRKYLEYLTKDRADIILLVKNWREGFKKQYLPETSVHNF